MNKVSITFDGESMEEVIQKCINFLSMFRGFEMTGGGTQDDNGGENQPAGEPAEGDHQSANACPGCRWRPVFLQPDG